jgi:hypothetical protein
MEQSFRCSQGKVPKADWVLFAGYIGKALTSFAVESRATHESLFFDGKEK